jgi:hypothetical protein
MAVALILFLLGKKSQLIADIRRVIGMNNRHGSCEFPAIVHRKLISCMLLGLK